LASAAPGRERQWHDRVFSDLAEVHAALEQHAGSAEAPHGVFAEISETQPAVLQRVEQLRREHADLLQQIQSLQRRFAPGGEAGLPQVADVRQEAARLLGALRQHQALEADLILESLCAHLDAD
jgi:hypothetical protein